MYTRKMLVSDYGQIYALWLSCPGMGLNNLDDSRDGIERFLKRNPDTCFVAEAEGRIVGSILAGNDGRRGYIYHTAVSPAHRHEGIGRGLTEAVLKALQRLGINKAALVVFDRNEDGNAFWEEMGFSVRQDLVYRNKALNEMIRIDT